MTAHYQTIVSLQADDYADFERALYPGSSAEDLRRGFLLGPPDLDAALEYLMQWDYGEAGETTPGEPRGENEYRKDEHVMTWSTGHCWAALHRLVLDET